MQPMVVTPRPLSEESWLGYLIRLSAANGYQSPSVPLRYAGVTQEELNRRQIRLEPVAALLGCKPEDIRYVDHDDAVPPGRGRPPRGGRYVRFAGGRLPTLYLRTKAPDMCPECVAEEGYISRFWSLKHAVACPKHNQTVIWACPDCGKKLSWFRPGLLTCRCGFDLSAGTNRAHPDPSILPMIELLRRRTLGLDVDNALVRERRYPVELMERLSLHALLSLIDKLGAVAEGAGIVKSPPESTGCPPGLALAVADSALSDWPRGFRQYLGVITSTGDASTPYYGFREAHNSLCERFFKGPHAKDYEFIYKEFVAYGREEWRGGVVDKRMFRGQVAQQRYCGLSEIAKHVGVQPGTARALIEDGSIPATVFKRGKATRYICDLDQVRLRRATNGESFAPRIAADILGIPVSVLKSLRSRRRFEFLYLGAKRRSFHELDLHRLFEAFHERAPLATTDDIAERSDLVSVAELMRRKLHGSDRKAKILEGVIDGSIAPVVRLEGKDLGSLLLPKSAVKALLASGNTRYPDYATITETAELLDCSPQSVPSLIQQGHLEVKREGCCTHVSRVSIDAFRDRFVSCSRVAQQLGTITPALLRRLRRREVPLELLYAERQSKDAPQPFFRKQFADELLCAERLRTPASASSIVEGGGGR